jgi:mono/diheme cytochrome c family protein
MNGMGDHDPDAGDPRPDDVDDPPPDRQGRDPDAKQGFDPAEISGQEEALPHEGEVDFETDVEYLHRAIYREAFEPAEGREPTPWWVWTLSMLAIFWGGWYLGHHGGTFDATPHLAYSRVQELVRKEEGEQTAAAIADPIQAGRAIYTARCQVCHQPTGNGVPGVFPPLIGAERVLGPPAGLVLIILHGLAGPITVAGQVYNGAMPAWGSIMSDAEVAAVATFIRQWETNRAPPVAPELVTELRAASAQRTTPWTGPELDAALQSPEIQGAAGQSNATPATSPGTTP